MTNADYTDDPALSANIPMKAETMKNADYANDLVLLKNKPTQVESLLHSPEQAAGNIGL